MFEIAEKPPDIYHTKVSSTTDVVNLKEVQTIKNALQEHLIFIGLDYGNNVRNISLICIGNEVGINVDTKAIVRTALVTGSEKVVLVHNHPSNSLKASGADKHITNITNKLLDLYSIKLQDHIIIAGDSYVSMRKTGEFDKEYTNSMFEDVDKALLVEENERLRNELEDLKGYQEDYEDDMEI